MPFPENTPTPDDLPTLSAAEIAALPVELLAVLKHESTRVSNATRPQRPGSMAR